MKCFEYLTGHVPVTSRDSNAILPRKWLRGFTPEMSLTNGLKFKKINPNNVERMHGQLKCIWFTRAQIVNFLNEEYVFVFCSEQSICLGSFHM